MAGSTFGDIFKVTTWGESHGTGVGVVVDGCPAGIELDESMIQEYLNRRKPGQNEFSTLRNEADKVIIESGVFEGRTTGTPISMIVYNQDQHSKDYSQIAECYRPGHADYTFDKKYGFRDYRGGGRSSGRETIGRVAAGAVAIQALNALGVEVTAYTAAIGDVYADRAKIQKSNILKSPLYMPDLEASVEAEEIIRDNKENKDSIGGLIDCIITGMPAGVGEPVFDKLDACLAKAVMSIGAVKGVQIGDGFAVVQSRGSQNNDSFSDKKDIKDINEENKQDYFFDKTGKLLSNIKKTNHAGGILGGMSDSDPILVTAAIKPTPSIASVQQTINKAGEGTDISIKGRHDPVIAPRAVVVVEAMAAITVFDLILRSMTSRIDRICKFFE